MVITIAHNIPYHECDEGSDRGWSLGKRSHTRNQRIGNQRGFPVAFSNGLSVALSNELSLFGGLVGCGQTESTLLGLLRK